VLEVNGTRHPLRAPGLVVGRGTEADLRINDPGVSRRHVEFMVNGDDLEVVDLGSTNGMLVNGSKVGRAGLRDGTEVKIGHTTMTVRVTEGG
jgi:pSer/pThr/pTyr-binding forkhead associated (FHA) protein